VRDDAHLRTEEADEDGRGPSVVSDPQPNDPPRSRWRRWGRPPARNTKALHHPVVSQQAKERVEDSQLRLADKITAVAGSMTFVYIHVVFFALWMLVLENNPWPTLTLIVSLEAIFLSTFVLISQNRQAAFQQAKADHDYQDINTLLEENTSLTRTIHQLTREVHDGLSGGSTATGRTQGGR
jgi:uncharacterized membrane protein